MTLDDRLQENIGGDYGAIDLVPDDYTQVKQAILSDLLEIIGEDDVQKPDEDEYDYPYCTTCDMCFFDGDKSNGCECTSHNKVRQELRDKVKEYCK